MNWVNLTEQSNGRIAAFVDFDWGVGLGSQHTVSTKQVKLVSYLKDIGYRLLISNCLGIGSEYWCFVNQVQL